MLNKSEVFLATRTGARSGAGSRCSRIEGETTAGFRGLVWSPDGTRLFASTSRGHVQAFAYKDGTLRSAGRIRIQPEGAEGEPGPRRDGDHPRRHAPVRRRGQPQRRRRGRPDDAQARARVPGRRRCRTSRGSRRTSGRWSSATGAAGRPRPGDRTAKSQDLDIVVDDRGAPASGTVSLIDRETGATRHVEVGIHPTAIVVRRRPRLRRQRDERLDQRDRPGGRHGRRGRSRCAGGRSACSAACPTPWPCAARRSTSPTAATTPWPRSTSPRARSAASATPDTSPPRSTCRTTARRPSCSTPRGTAR